MILLSEKLEGNKLGKSLSKAVKFTAEQIDEAVKALSEGGRTGAEYLEKNIFRPIALTFIRLCVFMTVYVLMEIVIRLILRLSGVFMVCTVINATENKLPKFNSAVFENTYLFSYFFDILYK